MDLILPSVWKFFLKKYGPIPASFLFIFVLFTSQINYKLKKRRWSAWDSNLGPQDGRRRLNHGAMVATLSMEVRSIFEPSPFQFKNSPSCLSGPPLQNRISKSWRRQLWMERNDRGLFIVFNSHRWDAIVWRWNWSNNNIVKSAF